MVKYFWESLKGRLRGNLGVWGLRREIREAVRLKNLLESL